MRAFLMAFLISIQLLPAAGVYAESFGSLSSEFDARGLSYDDKRFLQAALAFDGSYQGLLDGSWGRLSQEALERYVAREFDGPAMIWHTAFLATVLLTHIQESGWKVEFLSDLGISLLVPTVATTHEAPSQHFRSWRHSSSSLGYSVGRHERSKTQAFHDFAERWHELSTAPYNVRKPELAVTSAVRRDGSILYVRSDYIAGAWSTVMLSADAADASYLNAVSASISVGRALPLTVSEDGQLMESMHQLAAVIDQYEDEPPPETIGAEHGESGAGTGFYISSTGLVLTNAHVVSGCEAIYVDGNPAFVESTSDAYDLALLHSASRERSKVAVFASAPARLNSDVTVVGFPYLGKLSGLNVTRGSVSSLVGMGSDATRMQITAPVQAGNSGGPVVSADGLVVGVVVSKLDAAKVSAALGDVPQNVNFAIRGEIAKLFLAQNGVQPLTETPQDAISPPDLAEHVAQFTAFVECDPS